MSTLLIVAAVVLSSCSSSTPGVAAPAATATTEAARTTSSASPKPSSIVDVTAEFGENVIPNFSVGTAWTGCGTGDSADIQGADGVKVFDPVSGSVRHVPAPATPTGEVLQRSKCTVAGPTSDLEVVYIVQTETPAAGLNPPARHVRAYATKISSPSSTPRQQDITAQFPNSTKFLYGTVSGVLSTTTSSGGMIVSEKASVFVELAQLRRKWSVEAPVKASYDTGFVLEMGVWNPDIKKEILIVDSLGVEKHREPVATISQGGRGYLSYVGPLVTIQPSDGKERLYDMRTHTMVSPSTTAALNLSGNAVNTDGVTASSRSRSGLSVVDLASGKQLLSQTDEQLSAIKFDYSNVFDGHLYITKSQGASDAYSLIKPPSTAVISSSWAWSPIARMAGWTFVYGAPSGTTANGTCDVGISNPVPNRLATCSYLMVRDVDGRFPGPK